MSQPQIERTEYIERGTEITVKSKRGTGTRDQDEVKIVANYETFPNESQVEQILDSLYNSMRKARDMQFNGDDQE